MVRKLLALLLAFIMAFQPMVASAAEQKSEDEPAIGGGVTITILSKALSEGRLDFRAAWDLMKDWKTWTGALGGAAGYAIFGQIAQAFVPPGWGVFARVLPRFFGAALGFEFGRCRLDDIDPIAMLVQVAFSAAGYALASTILGATAPGWALMVGGTIFGLIANILIRKKVIPLPSGTTDDEAKPQDTPILKAAPIVDKASMSDRLQEAKAKVDEAYKALVDAITVKKNDVSPERTRYEDASRAFNALVAAQ